MFCTEYYHGMAGSKVVVFLERIFEEHEQVTEMLCFWQRETTNRVRFLERKDKYALFRNPQHYLLTSSETEGQMAERQKQTLIDVSEIILILV